MFSRRLFVEAMAFLTLPGRQEKKLSSQRKEPASSPPQEEERCYPIVPIAMTITPHQVKAGDLVHHLCEGEDKVVGTALQDADKGDLVPIMLNVSPKTP